MHVESLGSIAHRIRCETIPSRLISRQTNNPSRQGRGIARRYENSRGLSEVIPVQRIMRWCEIDSCPPFDLLRNSANGSGDYRSPAREGFRDGEAPDLSARCVDIEIGRL